MRILITGGFGYVGARLAVHLAKAGHKITLGTRQTISSPNWLSDSKVVELIWDDQLKLQENCKGIDIIIHAAGMNSKDCIADPVSALAFNGLATTRLVSAACIAKVKKFIYLSTAHVYSDPLMGVISEKNCPKNLHPYATSHLAGEYSILNAHFSKKIEGIVVRLSNSFGPPIHKDVDCWGLLINDLCRQALETRNMKLETSGLQKRDFIALSDVCKIIEYLANIQLEHNQPNIFNVGSGLSESVIEIAQLIQQQCFRVIGFRPELHLKKIELEEQFTELHYKSDNLKSIGIDFKAIDKELEIYQLLKFCEATFPER